MLPINLKKIWSHPQIISLVDEWSLALDIPIQIWDARGNLVGGKPVAAVQGTAGEKFTVEVEGSVIGWVTGGAKAAPVARMLSYVASKELEKKTLAVELLDKYREISFLYDISQKITASLDVQEVAKLALEEAGRITKSTGGLVWLLHEPTGGLETIAGWGYIPSIRICLAAGEGTIGRVASSGRGEIVNDVLSDRGFTDLGVPVRSMICVPLVSKNQTIGAIVTCCAEPVTYTALDLKLLTMLASHTASAMAIALMHDRTLQESRREALLFRLASQIRESLELNSILETAVSEIRSLLQLNRCMFMWHRGAKISGSDNIIQPQFARIASLGWEVVKESKNPDLPSLLGGYGVGIFGDFSGQLMSQNLLRVDEIEVFHPETARDFWLAGGFKSLLAVALQTGSGEMAVLCCGKSSADAAWSDHEVELLQAVGTQLAIAIHQAELYEQTSRAAATAESRALELQQALKNLQETQAQLIQSEKMSALGVMLASIAHEINNPVNFIYGNLSYTEEYIRQLLDRIELYQQEYPQLTPALREQMEFSEWEFLRGDLPKLVSSMRQGAERILEIVNSLRNFSRTDKGEMKAVDIHAGIDSTLVMLRHRLKAKGGFPGIEVAKEYAELPLVYGCAGQLNQVFMNILSNAIDALENHPQPQITIRTSVLASQTIGIGIRDNGPGIPEAVQQKLFDPFFTTKPEGKGTGLGLSISYQIVVEKHRGVLKCTSQGAGTEFWIEIPITPAAGNVSLNGGPRANPSHQSLDGGEEEEVRTLWKLATYQ